MTKTPIRIAVVAPACPVKPEVPPAVHAVAARDFPGRVEIVFHPQCFQVCNHFAGEDQERADALIEVANDPGFDAVWFGRGGYGAGRVADLVIPHLNAAARAKTYLGYSDLGMLLGGFYARGIGACVHGPMPSDVVRPGGEAAVQRALAWLVDKAADALESSIQGDQAPTAAFNMAVLSAMIGTPLQPDLSGHVLMLEEVSEYMYRIDRFLLHIASNPAIQRVAGLRLGRCSDVPQNDPDFGLDEETIARFWCAKAGIPYLGRADIGHDAGNRIVPFGRVAPLSP